MNARMNVRWTLRGVLVATAGAVLVLAGGTQRTPAWATHDKTLPPLRIVSPSDGATVRNPVSVVFETPADLSKMTMGGHGPKRTGTHLHIALDKRVNMPTMKQLVGLGAQRYRFHLGRAAPGRHTIRVYWADQDHKRLGPVHAITIVVR